MNEARAAFADQIVASHLGAGAQVGGRDALRVLGVGLERGGVAVERVAGKAVQGIEGAVAVEPGTIRLDST